MGLSFVGQHAAEPQFRGAQYAAMPQLRGGGNTLQSPDPQSAWAISTLEAKLAIRCSAQLRGGDPLRSPDPKAPGPFRHQVKAPSPFQPLDPKTPKHKALNPNHRGNTRSSSAFSHRRFEGSQPHFQWGHIQQLPLHRAPGAYRQAPTQEPSRE